MGGTDERVLVLALRTVRVGGRDLVDAGRNLELDRLGIRLSTTQAEGTEETGRLG